MKKWLCILLSVLMVWSALPVSALAETAEGQAGAAAEETLPVPSPSVTDEAEEEKAEAATVPASATPAQTENNILETDLTVEEDGLTEGDLASISIKDLSDMAGLVLNNTKYADVFKKISDPINVYAGILGAFQQEAFNQELLNNIHDIQNTLSDIKADMAYENREIETSLNEIKKKLDVQSYTSLMNQVKNVDQRIDLLMSDYAEMLEIVEDSQDTSDVADMAAEWIDTVKQANLDQMLADINTVMSAEQNTDCLLAVSERLMRQGYPFEHQMRDPMYATCQYVVGVRQRLLFLYSEYYSYLDAGKSKPTHATLYAKRYNLVVESINQEVAQSGITKLADPEKVVVTMPLRNTGSQDTSPVKGYHVISNATQKSLFIAKANDPMGSMITSTIKYQPAKRHPYLETFIHNNTYPAEDITGHFKLINNTEALRRIFEPAYAVRKERALDWLVNEGGLDGLKDCKALMIDRYQEGIKGPLLYTDTETLDGRQSLFDANDMVYNTLDKDVQEISYLACALGHATPYPFGGGEAVSWSSAPLLIILEDASHTPDSEETFAPETLDSLQGADPGIGNAFGNSMTLDLSKLNTNDLQGKTLHINGFVTLDGGGKSFNNLAVTLENNATLVLRNVSLTGMTGQSVLLLKENMNRVGIAGKVTLTPGDGGGPASGITAKAMDATLSLYSAHTDGEAVGTLVSTGKNGGAGIDVPTGLDLTDLHITATGAGSGAPGIKCHSKISIQNCDITAAASDESAADIGSGVFSTKREAESGVIENSKLTLAHHRISGFIRVAGSCSYTNGVPYYVTFIHGGEEDYETDHPGSGNGEFVDNYLYFTVTGTRGSRDFKVCCNPTEMADPEVCVLENGVTSQTNIGSPLNVCFNGFDGSDDDQPPYPHTLRIALGSPLGEGEEASRFDCYRDMTPEDLNSEGVTFNIDDLAFRLALIYPENNMPSGLQLSFSGIQADGASFKTDWLSSKNMKTSSHDGIDNYYLNLEDNPTSLSGIYLKRTDGAKNPVKLMRYLVMPLKKSDNQETIDWWVQQWLTTEAPYAISLDDGAVNSYNLEIQLAPGQRYNSDFTLEIEGSEGTQRTTLRKNLPGNTALSDSPQSFNLLFDSAVGTPKRIRLTAGNGTTLNVASLALRYNQPPLSIEDSPVFYLKDTAMAFNSWYTLATYPSVDDPEKPDEPDNPVQPDNGGTVVETTELATAPAAAKNPLTGTPVSQEASACAALVLLALFLSSAFILKRHKS